MKCKEDGGFTFLETLAVLAITTILTAGIGIPAFRYIERARQTSARCTVESFRLALNSYYLDCAIFPSNDQGLSALTEKPVLKPVPDGWNGPYLDRPPGTDPWGNEWIYRIDHSNAQGTYFLGSNGKDGKEGGTGDNGDISSDN